MIGRSYVELMRNLPPLIIIFIFYYFLSDQIMPIIGIDNFLRSSSPGIQQFFELLFAPPQYASAFISALFTLAVFEGAYITEIVRAGIQSVEKGAMGSGACPLGCQNYIPCDTSFSHRPYKGCYHHSPAVHLSHQGFGNCFRYLYPRIIVSGNN